MYTVIMDSYKTVLAVGGKTNSLGRAAEVIESVYSEPSRLKELFDCILAEDPWVRMRAIDSFEKIIKTKPDWAEPYIAILLDTLTLSDQPSIQWHLAQLFTEVKLTSIQRNNALVWLKSKIKTTNVDWIVSVNAMNALLYFQKKGYVETSELEALCEIQAQHPSKSVRKKAMSMSKMLAE
jgi:hypothetical protein